jgi:Mrp family chromosome partitioning ATPase
VADTEAIIRPDGAEFSVVPAGKVDMDTDPELLANGVLGHCLRRWRGQFDVVVFDSPPVVPVADARIVSGNADGTILVVREKHCHRAEVADALGHLGACGGTLLGLVFVGSELSGAYHKAYYHGYGQAVNSTSALDVRQV